MNIFVVDELASIKEKRKFWGTAMLYRAALYLIGFGLSVAGGINIIAYLNLLPMGFSYSHYFLYIGRRPECYLLLAGLILIWFSVYGLSPKE